MMFSRLFFVCAMLCRTVLASMQEQVMTVVHIGFYNEANISELLKNKKTTYHKLIKQHPEYYTKCTIRKNCIQCTVSISQQKLEKIIKKIKQDEGVELVQVIKKHQESIHSWPIIETVSYGNE